MEILTQGYKVTIVDPFNNGDITDHEALDTLERCVKKLELGMPKKRPWDADPSLFAKASNKIKKTSKKVTEGWGKLSFTEKCMAVTTGTVALKVAVSAFRELRLAWRFR